jgi:hypothetical protein
VELRFRGRAWSDQNALDIEATATGVWIDVDRNSILPEEIRRTIPAWHGRAVSVQLQPTVQARLTMFGQEQLTELEREPNRSDLFLAFLCASPVQGRVAVHLLGNEGPAPGAVRQDAVNGAILEALKDIANAIRELKGSPRGGVPTIQGPETNAPAQDEPAKTIVFQGKGVYVVGRNQFRVTEQEDCVLQAFLEQPAMTKDELTAISGTEKAVDILRALRTTKYDGAFTGAISMPGGRGRGGYRVQVVRAASSDQTG